MQQVMARDGEVVKPILLEKGQHRQAADVFVRAFFDYPLFTYFAPDLGRRDRDLRLLFEFTIESAIRHGRAYAVSPGLEGVALWYARDSVPTTFSAIADGALGMMARAGIRMSSRMVAWDLFSTPLRHRNAPPRYSYLQLLAVDPQLQGKGVGRSFMLGCMAAERQFSPACYLETESDQNVVFYEKLGFSVTEAALYKGGVLNSWAMSRPL